MSGGDFSLAQLAPALAVIGAGVYRGPSTPGGAPSHSAYCHAELRQVADLVAEAAWWRWLSGWLLAACLALLAALLFLAWTFGVLAGCCGGCLCRRRPVAVAPRWERPPAPVPHGAVKGLTYAGHGVRVGA